MLHRNGAMCLYVLAFRLGFGTLRTQGELVCGGVQMKDNSAIWAACVVIGTALGALLGYFTSYALGIPLGGALGVGVAFLLTSRSTKE
jgi:hypothetical protein